MKKTVSIFLTILMLLSLLPMAAFAEELNQPKLTVDSVDATPGDTATVNISLKNNPGFVSASINLAFDDGLTLIGATNGNTFPPTIAFTMPNQLKQGGEIKGNCNFAWSGTDIDDADIKDGVILALRFRLSEDAEIGDVYNITVSARSNDFVDRNLQTVEMQPAQGKITVIDYTPGDVNDDGSISMLDTVMISRYVVDGCKYDPDGYAIRLNEKAADVNDDSSISMLDTVMISRYIVDGCKTDPNGYNIELKGSTKKCQHEMQATEAKAATCTEDGNIAFWYCEKCEKYFSDANGSRVITLDDTVVKAKGHTVVIDPAVPATYESTGLTEGSHCSVCNTVLVKQGEVPMLTADTYTVVYHLWDNDTEYLKTVELENPNNTVNKCDKSLRLQPIVTESDIGFTFEYWYQKGEDKATTVIAADTMEDGEIIHLYAKWTKREYTIQFETNLVPVDEEKFTVDKEKTLPSDDKVHVDGYIFAGWSDENGDIITRIPKGTTGDKVFTANYISERNQAWTKNKLDDSIIIEDEETNTILFTYEIGEIRNVPLYVINDFGKINASGISQTVTKTFSTTISDSLMNNYTNTVAKAVTDSYGVTLSNGWSDSTSLDESWAEEKGMTQQEAEEYCKSDTNGWYVSSGSSGSKSVTTVSSSQNYDLTSSTNSKYANATATESKYDDNELHVDANLNANLGINLGSTLTKTKNNKKSSSNSSDTTASSTGISGGISAGGTTSWGSSSSTTAYAEILDASTSQRGNITSSGINASSSSSWHNDSGKSASSTVSNSSSVSKAVSEMISEKYDYGKSYIETGNESTNQTQTASQTDSEQYSNTVTYSKATSETETVTYTTTNTASGYHRWIMAGTAHVFAIVGYDIASKSYFITTYSVMDDEMHKYEDYSYSDPLYKDNQNGQISFEIPVEVKDYVAERVCETEGLEVSKNGIITNYTGTDDYVIIPEYKVIENLDGTTQVIKVVGISETAFQNNGNIVAVELSENISSIPDNAFKNCTSLLYVYGADIISIGDNAFSGCTSLEYAIIDDTVEHIGTNTFDCAKAIAINAANASVVDAVINSGAENIVVYISDRCENFDNKNLSISNTTDSFTFNGMGKNYVGLVIDSNAEKRTAIYRTNITSSTGTPVKVNSEVLELDECTLTAPGIAMKVVDDYCNIKLYGESTLNSVSGKAMLCKNIVTGQIKNDFESKLTVNGDVLINGHVITEGKEYTDDGHTEHNGCDDTDYVKCLGRFVHINETEFNKYLVGTFKVNFDANGGSIETGSITAQYGSPLGTLPKPTKANYVFDGWYTAQTGGELVTSTTVPEDAKDMTVYAHWTLNTYTLSFNPNGGSVSETSRTATCSTAIGTLPTPTRTGFTFNGWYTAASGGSKATSTSQFSSATTLYAHWTCNSYTASWSTGTGYSITVKRTSSPNGGAAIGNISSGEKVYYGDVLSITYSASTGYSLGSKGKTSITVTRNVTSSDIYASASVNSYTYNVVYKSTNGTNLGSTTVTKNYGTTNTISAPAKTGYNTPSSQSVKWDSTSAKTITFTYTPISQPSRQTITTGNWWTSSSGNTHLTYKVEAEWRNRTANSIDIRIIWTNTITNGYNQGQYGYKQEFEWWGWYQIAAASAFRSAGGTRTASNTSGWHTYSIAPGDTSWTTGSEWRDNNGKSGDWSGTIYFPAY